VQVELLADARGIFKKKKVQGTSPVLETFNNNSGGDANAPVDEILHKCRVISVENNCIWGFYMGSDKYKEIVEKLRQLAAMVSELISDEGLEVDSVSNTFKVTFGGMLGDVGWAVCFLLIYVYYQVFPTLAANLSCSLTVMQLR
jgi:hypothetical protein